MTLQPCSGWSRITPLPLSVHVVEADLEVFTESEHPSGRRHHREESHARKISGRPSARIDTNDDDRGGGGSSIAGFDERIRKVSPAARPCVAADNLGDAAPQYLRRGVRRNWQVLWHKRPADSSIAIDNDAAVCARLRSVLVRSGDGAGVTVICDDAISWLEKNRGELNERTLVYCDPPYLFDSRASRRKRYDRELGESWSHQSLLAVLSRLTTQRVKVLVSGYRSQLYDELLGQLAPD